MSATTKERILDAAEEIMLEKSFCSVGLNQILSAVQVPKGSFYHYFQSKEQFGVDLLRHYIAEHTARLKRVLLTPDLNAFDRLHAYFNGAISQMLEGECKQCCLVAKLGSEVSTFSEPMREVLAEGMRQWRGIYEQMLRDGQEAGFIRKDLDPADAAAFVQDAWQGAMHRAQIERCVTPLRCASEFICRSLRPV
jgi:TetR/AcrR family transcriptional repressor of nem operon